MKFILDKESYVVEYSVTENVTENMPSYGISVSVSGKTVERMDNLFFTKEEAIMRCNWLKEKDVMPEIFRDIMADIML